MLAALVVALIGVCGCGSDSLVNIEFGSLTIDTVTTGSNLDDDGYDVEVNGPSLAATQPIGLNDQFSVAVAPGAYTALLSDVADNCAVEINPLEAVVAGGIKAVEITFSVPGAPKVIAQVNKAMGADLCLGAGTVMTNVWPPARWLRVAHSGS